MLFGKKKTPQTFTTDAPVERVTTVLGPGISWKGDLRGKGGVRIEGALEGEISIRGMVIVGETGRVTSETIKADSVVVAGVVNGKILSEKLEIRATGRVYGDVTAKSFSTEEGAFLRGKVTMEDAVDLSDLPSDNNEEEASSNENQPAGDEV
ncbi:MAG: polymer-forming cytoskeletal protein [Brevefilum sp.]|nr:polymer-forming cytoskeletal protein [Brevefilum sp.]